MINKIQLAFHLFFILVNIVIKSIFKKNKVFLLGVPLHGNLGDQAILIAEEEFLKENYPKYNVIYVPSIIVSRLSKLLKILINENELILLHGGGYLGNLWINEEKMFRECLISFPNNRIIVFPQTIFFTDDEEGKNEYTISKNIYESHKHLTIFVREEYSYNYMKSKFNCEVCLVPDIVLYLTPNNLFEKEDKILLCLRSDREKTLDFNILENCLTNDKAIIERTDTVIERQLYSFKQKKHEINKKLEQFGSSKLVITDRLHGMVFAYLTGVPCIVINSMSYKVKGVYEWLKSDKKIIFVKDKDVLNDAVKSILSFKDEVYQINFKKDFKPLVNKIDEYLKM